MRSMIEVCKLRSTHAGPLFCHSDTSPSILDQFNADLPSCLGFSGLYTSRYKGHSFQIRAASHAVDKGFSDVEIRTLGRWKSDAF